MKILNLGCGTKVSAHPSVTNIDWSIYLQLKKNPVTRAFVPLVIRGERLSRFRSLPDNILVHNLAKGIPLESDSVDAVYHSHFLEHLDKNVVTIFLQEVRRVLKPNGIQRIVVPDMELLCRNYISHIACCESDSTEFTKHDSYVADIIEQSVRKEPYGTSQQTPLRRRIENMLLGDARKRGETHQWMYDKINLSSLLTDNGYHDPIVQKYNTSITPNWNDYRLDVDEHGNEYKRESLYIEARK